MLRGLFVLQVVIRATALLDCCKAASDASACCQEVQETGDEISTLIKIPTNHSPNKSFFLNLFTLDPDKSFDPYAIYHFPENPNVIKFIGYCWYFILFTPGQKQTYYGDVGDGVHYSIPLK